MIQQTGRFAYLMHGTLPPRNVVVVLWCGARLGCGSFRIDRRPQQPTTASLSELMENNWATSGKAAVTQSDEVLGPG